MTDIFQRSIGVASRALAYVAGITLLMMMFLVSADVTGRYVFTAPITGALEITEMLLVVSVFFSISYTETIGAHIRVRLLSSRLPDKWQNILNILGAVLGVFTCAFMIWKTFTYAAELMAVHATPWVGPQVPLCIPAITITLGFSLLFLQLCFYIIGIFRHKIEIGSK